jgi:cytidylate kinase
LESVTVIAIDGPAGVGKSTAAKRLAVGLGYYFLSSGMIYRAMAWHLLAQGWNGSAESANVAALEQIRLTVDGQGEVWLDGRKLATELRTEAVSAGASAISAIPAVRDLSNRVQRETVAAIGRDQAFPGVILEGRDIGTVVFPAARHKFFLTAREDVRAQRRFLELEAKQPGADRGEVRRALRERDARDSSRAVAPLVPAADARIVDTSDFTLDQVVERLLAMVKPPH